MLKFLNAVVKFFNKLRWRVRQKELEGALNRVSLHISDVANDLYPRQPWLYQEDRPDYQVVRKGFKCEGGVTLSIQFSATHYCSKSEKGTPTVELWCCPHHPLLAPYGDGEEPYAYVPVDVLAAYIVHMDKVKV